MAYYANTILYIYKSDFLDLVPKLFSISIYPRMCLSTLLFFLKSLFFSVFTWKLFFDENFEYTF